MALKETLNANFKQLSEENKVNNAYLTGGLSTEKKMFEQVKAMKRSTFDRSKFEVVGSPVITDDGVASGFSGSNYIYGYNFNQQVLTNFRFTGEFSTTTNVSDFLLSIGTVNYRGVALFISNNKISIMVATNNGSSWRFNGSVSDTLADNSTYKYILELKNGNIKLYLAKDNLEYTEYLVASDITGVYFDGYTNVGYRGNNASQYFKNGSIDLKQFSISVDGVEVFNGNKTGIDQIKKDDYEIVGSPTITDDGIASGFSGSNYLINNVVVKPNNKLEIIFKFTTSSDITSEQYIVGGTLGDTAERFALSIKSNGFQIPFGASSINDISKWGLIGTPVANAINFIKITWDGAIYNILHSLDENNWQIIRSINSTVAIDFSSLWIGLKYGALNYFFKGSIDINALKIYIDGNLVYQPCLKIPYTQSKTGSKIVDSIYRDRVQDMYEQFGYAPYYTLGETDFTLPVGEIYGMKADKSELVNKADKSEVDGQWVEKYLVVANNVSLGGSLPYIDYDLSSYLPDDGYDYEIMFSGNVTTGGTSGNYCILYIRSSILNIITCICSSIARTSASAQAGGNISFPVGSNKIVQVYNKSTYVGRFNLYAHGYRRLGKSS